MKIIKGHNQKKNFRKYRIRILGFFILFILIVSFFAGVLSHKKGYMNIGLSEIIETNASVTFYYKFNEFMIAMIVNG